MDSVQKVIRNVISSGPINAVRFATGFATNIYLARQLTPEIFGAVALGLSIATFFSLFSRWGLTEAMSQGERKPELLSTMFWMRIGYAFLLIMAVAGGVIIFGNFYDQEVVYATVVISAGFVFRNVTGPFRAALEAEFELLKVNLFHLLSLCVAAAVAIWGVFHGWSIGALLAFYFFQDAVVSILFLVFSPQYPSIAFNRKTAIWLLRFGGKILGSRILQTAETRGDDYLVGTVGDTTILGFYTIAWRLTSAFRSVFQPVINQGIVTSFGRFADHDDRSRRSIEFILRVQLLLLVPAYLALAVNAESAILLLVGQQWILSADLIPVLAVAGVLFPLVQTIGKFYHARNEAEKFVGIQLVYLSLLFGGIVVLLPTFGGIGVAIAVSTSSIVGFFLCIYRLKSDVAVRFTLLAGPSVAPTIAACLSVLILRRFELFLFVPKLLEVIVSSAVIGGVFLTTLLVVSQAQLREDATIIKDAYVE